MGLSPDAWVSIGTNLLNVGSQQYTNAKNRQFALADWNRLNAYNTPAEQMKRFQAAGLNKNLIYNQRNEASPVRSTDYVAPQLDTESLQVFKKSNQFELQELSIENLQQEVEGNKLRNEEQRIKNDILANTKLDLMDKPSILNRVQNASYDNLIESANLKRLERSQFPIRTDILKEQLRSLATSNEYQKLNIMQKYDINELLKEQIKAATESNRQANTIGALDVETRQRLEQILQGSGSTTGGKIANFFGTILKSFIPNKSILMKR
jgi:hypothetical protein